LTNKYIGQQIFDDMDVSTVQDIDYSSTKHLIDHIIEQMPLKRRTVFIKSRFEGFTVKEIADNLGTSPKTVENQLGEALKFVREHLHKENSAGIIFFVLFCS